MATNPLQKPPEYNPNGDAYNSNQGSFSPGSVQNSLTPQPSPMKPSGNPFADMIAHTNNLWGAQGGQMMPNGQPKIAPVRPGTPPPFEIPQHKQRNPGAVPPPFPWNPGPPQQGSIEPLDQVNPVNPWSPGPPMPVGAGGMVGGAGTPGGPTRLDLGTMPVGAGLAPTPNLRGGGGAPIASPMHAASSAFNADQPDAGSGGGGNNLGGGGATGTGGGTGGPPATPGGANGNTGVVPPVLPPVVAPPSTGQTGTPTPAIPPNPTPADTSALARYSSVPGYEKLAQNPQWLAAYYDFAQRPGNAGVDVVDFLNDMYPGQFDTSKMPADAQPGRKGYDTWKYQSPGVLRGFGFGTTEGGSFGAGGAGAGSGTPTDNGNGTITTWHGATPPDTPQPTMQELMDMIKKLQAGGGTGAGTPATGTAPPAPVTPPGPPAINPLVGIPHPNLGPPIGGASTGGPHIDNVLPPPSGNPGGAPSGQSTQDALSALLNPMYSQQQQNLKRSLDAEAAKNGDINSGGYGENRGTALSNLAAQQGSQQAQMAFQAQQADLDRAQKYYETNTSAAIAQAGQRLQQYGIDINATMQQYGIDTDYKKSIFLANLDAETRKYAADKSLSAAQASAMASTSAARIAAQSSQHNADLQYQLGVGGLDLQNQGQIMNYILGLYGLSNDQIKNMIGTSPDAGIGGTVPPGSVIVKHP